MEGDAKRNNRVTYFITVTRGRLWGSRESLGSGNTILNAQSGFIAREQVGKRSKDLADVIQLKCRADTRPSQLYAVDNNRRFTVHLPSLFAFQRAQCACLFFVIFCSSIFEIVRILEATNYDSGI